MLKGIVMLNKITGLIAAIWVGAILAIGMEAKVKFNASLIDLRIGLDVGRTVFTAFDYAQWGLMILLMICVLLLKNKKIFIILAAFFIAFIYQSLLILPILITMADIYINYGFVEKSYIHLIYILIEVIKIILLVYLANLAYNNDNSTTYTSDTSIKFS